MFFAHKHLKYHKKGVPVEYPEHPDIPYPATPHGCNLSWGRFPAKGAPQGHHYVLQEKYDINIIQEISNKTLLNGPRNLMQPEYLIARLQLIWGGPLVRSHSIFDGYKWLLDFIYIHNYIRTCFFEYLSALLRVPYLCRLFVLVHVTALLASAKLYVYRLSIFFQYRHVSTFFHIIPYSSIPHSNFFFFYSV